MLPGNKNNQYQALDILQVKQTGKQAGIENYIIKELYKKERHNNEDQYFGQYRH
jgi:hypothetical protein